MIDFGLLVSVIAALGVPALLSRFWSVSSLAPETTVVDAFLLPAAVGLVVGRLVTLAIDDPGSIGSVSDMLVIRSGVEFWPGVAAAMATAAWQGRRAPGGPLGRLADLTPLAMVGYGSYEAACLFRDGCYGPVSALGLRPDGLDVKMVPIGLLMAIGVFATAALARGLCRSGWPAGAVTAAGLTFIAITRSVASIWLPRLGSAPTRQHTTSVGVAVLAGGACLAAVRLGRRQPGAAAP